MATRPRYARVYLASSSMRFQQSYNRILSFHR
jgi:hypothetical protein